MHGTFGSMLAKNVFLDLARFPTVRDASHSDHKTMAMNNVPNPNRPPPVRYVMLFPGRTGSTYLTDHMASHPQIVANYEILSQYQESWEQQEEFLEDMIGTKRRPRIQAIGFKTKVSSVLAPFKFEKFLKENEFRIIHLTRKNQLKFIVSIVRAKQLRERTGTSNLIFQSQEAVGATTIPLVEFAQAKRRLRRRSRLTRIIDRMKLPTIEIAYEDLLTDEQAILKRLWGFLDVRNVATVGKTRKNTPQDLRQAVTNLDEIIDQHPEMARYVDQL